MFALYMHRNKSNGKVYIGYTSRDVVSRWGKNGAGYLTTNRSGQFCQPRFASAIIKYGWDNFEHIIIRDDIKTIEDAHNLEKLLIGEYNSTDEKFGYNMTDGGEGMSGVHPSQETREKMSIAKKGKTPWNKGVKGQVAWNKGQPHSAETKMKISNSQKGRTPWNKGTKGVMNAWNKGMVGQYSQETIEKMTIANRSVEKINRTKEVNSVAVYLVELNKIYPSIEIAHQETKVHKGNIVQVCKGKRKTAGGYHWRYAGEIVDKK